MPKTERFRIVVYQGRKKVFDVKADDVKTHQERNMVAKMVEAGKPQELVPSGVTWGSVHFQSYKRPRYR